MCFCKYFRSDSYGFIVLLLFIPLWSTAQTRTWTGYGGDASWSNPLNWSGQILPQSVDDVLLDNGDMPVSYQVILPDTAVVLRTLRIRPSPGRNIELLLPSTNLITDAFSVTGPGYGIDLSAGAVFRNASGLSSGESLRIADSLIIRDGARYIHQTRAAHANSILRLLSVAPGTEEGIFDFDVPRAAYTISVSNRTYGSLELHATTYGATVSYTCTGASPLQVRGNLRIGPDVRWNLNLNGNNGNVQVEGDFIQEGGQLNISSGGTSSTGFRVAGDIYQSPAAIITETSSGLPFIEMNGGRLQEIAFGGQILNQVGLRVNNGKGVELRLPLTVPWKLEMQQGVLYSSYTNLLILDSPVVIAVDSSRLSGIYVDGPIHKKGLLQEDHFLFPVGKEGNLRWLELKNASGNYTVEYIRENPAVIGTKLGTGLDHISRLEYWKVLGSGGTTDQSKIELSYVSAQSGGVTDPNYLNVAMFQSEKWENAGHSSITGNYLQGSVISANTDFAASYYTLASTVNLENPLPITILEMKLNESSGKLLFRWRAQSPERIDHFELMEENYNQSSVIAQVQAMDQQMEYHWLFSDLLKSGIHYFRIRMVNMQGEIYNGNMVSFEKEDENIRLRWISKGLMGAPGRFLIQSSFPDHWNYEIVSADGRTMRKGIWPLDEGKNYLDPGTDSWASGIYIFRGQDAKGKIYLLGFEID